MKVAVLGAAGTIAPALVRDLAESEEVESLRLLDVDGDRAAAVARAYGGGKADSLAIDARDPQRLACPLSQCDVLVNAASYRINAEAMHACLEARINYIDLGGLYWMTGRQLELGPVFEHAGLLALLGMGSAPGKTNVMARAGARALGNEWRLDEAHVYAAGRNLDPDAPLAAPYAIQTLRDELEMRPVVVRDGEPVEIAPMTGAGERDFGKPIGTADLIHTLHSELCTFPDSFGVREATFNLSLPPGLVERLDEVTATVAPSANTVSVHIVVCVRDGRTVTVRAVTRPMADWSMGGGVVSTAAPAAAAVRLMARGRIGAIGALAPERCIDPDDLFPELERRGCEFSVEEAKEVATT